MVERSCRSSFLYRFLVDRNGPIGVRQVDFSDEVPSQFYLLPTIAVGLIRRMDDVFLEQTH